MLCFIDLAFLKLYRICNMKYDEIIKALGLDFDNMSINEYEMLKKVLNKAEIINGKLVIGLNGEKENKRN